MVSMMTSKELVGSQMWERSVVDIEALANLIISIRGGWLEGHDVYYQEIDGKNVILWGHRRVLAAVLGEILDGKTVDDLIPQLSELVTTVESGNVCPTCGTAIDIDMSACPLCGTPLWGHDNVNDTKTSLAVTGPVKKVRPERFVEYYDDMIHLADVEVPTTRMDYTDELSSWTTLLADNMNREEPDIMGLARAVKMIVDMGGTETQITHLGITKSKIKYYLALAQTPPAITARVEAGKLPLSVPYKIMQLNLQVQRDAVYAYIVAHNIKKANDVDDVIRKIKDFVVEPPGFNDSPFTANRKKATAYVAEHMGEDLWSTIAIFGRLSSGTVVDAMTDEAMKECGLGCDTCPLKGKMHKLNLIAGSVIYPCQRDPNYSHGCFAHSSRVYADYHIGKIGLQEYDDGTSWFPSFDDAAAVYGLVADNEVPDPVSAPVKTTRDFSEQITAFAEKASTMAGRDHPFSAHCGKCKWYDEEKQCLVARDREIHGGPVIGHLLYIEDEKGYQIPLCGMYAPREDPIKTIPETDYGAMYNVKETAKILTGHLAMSGIIALPNVTGVPFNAMEHFSHWFWNILEDQRLTDGQCATLVEWLTFQNEIGLDKSGHLALVQGRIGEFKWRNV